MKGGSIPAVCRQRHATLRFCEKRSVARSEAKNRQIRGKTTANTAVSALFQPKPRRDGPNSKDATLRFPLDTRSVASKCSVEVPRCYHAAVEAGASGADNHA